MVFVKLKIIILTYFYLNISVTCYPTTCAAYKALTSISGREDLFVGIWTATKNIYTVLVFEIIHCR